MRAVINFAARRLAVQAAAYYRFDRPLVDDAEHDALVKLVADNWDWLDDFFKETFESAEAIRATTHHIYISAQCYNSVLHELREMGVDEDLGDPGFEPTAQWEGEDGSTIEIMEVA